MAGSHVLLQLVIVLGLAALTTVVFQRLRQPVVLGYLLTGLLIGPHVPFSLVADGRLVGTLSELGVILLMFSIGLEFSIRRIARVGAGAALTCVIEVGLMLSLGFLAGRLLGLGARESLFCGACVAISSTMLVVKAFEAQRVRDPLAGMVYAILVFEDMVAILLLALLTGVAGDTGLSGLDLAILAGKLVGFLAALLAGGLLVVPRAIRLVARLERSETLLIASMAVCFAMALLAERAGYSVALGAFLGGMLVSESGEGAKVEALIIPFRDVFAALFFVAVGMSIEPAEIAGHAGLIVALAAVVIAGKLAGVTVGAFLAGSPLGRALQAGMSLGQVGEFSFIIAGLGLASGAVRGFLLPVMVAVSCLTALSTPWIIRASGRAAHWLDGHLPRRLETFVTFYGSWIEDLRAAPRSDTLWRRLRASVALLVLDAALLGATVVAGSTFFARLVALLTTRVGLHVDVARALVVAVMTGTAFLFLLGVVRRAARLARKLAAEVLPPSPEGRVDLGTAPRRVLVLTLELAIVLVVGLPLLAATQAFLPAGVLALGIVVSMIGVGVWRSMANLQGHVRAGSELIVELLARQSRAATAPELAEVRALLPGMSGLAPVRLAAGSPAVGRTLRELDLRALTGATVLAIHRGEGGMVLPSAEEVLRPGDVLALAGGKQAIDAARMILAD